MKKDMRDARKRRRRKWTGGQGDGQVRSHCWQVMVQPFAASYYTQEIESMLEIIINHNTRTRDRVKGKE